MSDKLTAIAAGVIFAVIWSVSFVVASDAVSGLPPLGLLSFRLMLAGVVLLGIYHRSIIKFWNSINTPTKFRVIISGVLSHSVYLGCNFWALETVPTSITNIVVSSLPILMIPLAYVILHESIRLLNIIAVSLGILGVFITIDAGSANSGQTFNVFEVSLVVSSVIGLAIGNVLAKTFINRHNFLQVCSIQFLVSGIALIPIVALIEEPLPMKILFQDYLFHILFMVSVASISGTVLWFRVLDTFSANEASSFFLLTPIMGIILGFIFFAEPITYGKIIGGGIITASIALKVLPHIKQMFTKHEHNNEKY